MAKKYTFIRVDKDAKDALNSRIKKLNKEDLKKLGLKNQKVPQIEFTKFLFKTPIFISDKELRNMAKKMGGRIC
jgi:hypothetical protein